MTLFDHLKNIFVTKTNWNKLSDADKKTWNSFMVNKYISMQGGTESILVNTLQKYNVDPEIQYRFYKSVLPAGSRQIKYIKGSGKTKEQAEMIDILAKQMEISKREAGEYIDLLSEDDKTTMLQELGYDQKEIKKILK